MEEDVFEKLAKKLDSHPSGFPRTKTGIELKLLKKIFTEEEAALANDMQWIPETVKQIVERTGRDPVKTGEMLQNMIKKGQIHGFPMGDDFAFIGLPFIVGIYFFNAPYIDEELAKLFEEYYKSWAEGSLHSEPSYHRVIPVNKSIPIEFDIFPHEMISTILKDVKSFGLFPCMCKLQKQKIDDSCKHPTNTCFVFSQFDHAFDNIPSIESLTKEEAFKTLKEFEDIGLVHTMGNFRDPNPAMDFICNCCSCGCTFLRGVSELGIENSVAKSNFYADIDTNSCIGCKTCFDRCQFQAIRFENDKSFVDKTRCAGCGLCVTTCKTNAIKLTKKSEDEAIHTPQNIQDWTEERAKNRIKSLDKLHKKFQG